VVVGQLTGAVDEEGNISSAHAPTSSDNRLSFFTWNSFSPRTPVSFSTMTGLVETIRLEKSF